MALSDGVIAIALTLLVLDLKLPEIPEGAGAGILIENLATSLPNFIGWIISFVMIARVWHEQHIVWSHAARCDSASIMLMLILLGACSLIPFASAMTGEYSHEWTAVLVFSAIMTANGLAIAALAGYVARGEHLHNERGPGPLRSRAIYHATVVPLVGVFAVLMGYWHHPLVGISAWVIEPLGSATYWRLTGRAG